MRTKAVLKSAAALGAALLLGAAPAAAAPKSPFSQQQLSTFSVLFSGYTAGLDCNMEVDTGVAAQFVRSRLGDATYSPDQLAFAAFMVVGIEGMHQTFPVDCGTARAAFGPHGKSIPGLLK